MRIEWIDDSSDVRIADFRELKDAALRRDRGLFVAEGGQIVRRLLAGRHYRARSVLATPAGVEGVRDLLDAGDGGLDVYLAEAATIRAVAGYPFHRGCLAVAERGAETLPEAIVDSPGRRTVVVLESVTNPDNIGGVFRNAFAFGADAVLLSGRCADPLYRKAIRVSAGASLQMPFARLTDWPTALARLKSSGYAIIALTPDGAVEIDALGVDHAGADRLALLVGAEDHGLTPGARAWSDVEARIAMAPGADSLNVATAAGIALHQLRRRR